MNAWFETVRNEAEKKVNHLPFPTNKNENFRFTRFEESELVSSGAPLREAEAINLFPEELAVLDSAGAKILGNCDGFTFTSLAEAVNGGNELAKRILCDSKTFVEDKFAQLAKARWTNGIFMHVPAGTKIGKPLRALQNLSHARSIVVLEKESEAILFQEFSGKVNLDLLEVKLAAFSKLHLIMFQNISDDSAACLRQNFVLEKGSELTITMIQLGGKTVQVRSQIELLGECAKVDIKGAIKNSGDQHTDLWLEVDHLGSRSESSLDFSYVMNERSSGVFNGLLKVLPQAKDCSAVQKSRGLLMGNKSTMHAIPRLIIQTDEVKCSHGASIATINPEQIHYLQSRGITKADGERMIERGYLENILKRIENSDYYDRIESALERNGVARVELH